MLEQETQGVGRGFHWFLGGWATSGGILNYLKLIEAGEALAGLVTLGHVPGEA